jgi:hypothetical protein
MTSYEASSAEEARLTPARLASTPRTPASARWDPSEAMQPFFGRLKTWAACGSLRSAPSGGTACCHSPARPAGQPTKEDAQWSCAQHSPRGVGRLRSLAPFSDNVRLAASAPTSPARRRPAECGPTIGDCCSLAPPSEAECGHGVFFLFKVWDVRLHLMSSPRRVSATKGGRFCAIPASAVALAL